MLIQALVNLFASFYAIIIFLRAWSEKDEFCFTNVKGELVGCRPLREFFQVMSYFLTIEIHERCIVLEDNCTLRYDLECFIYLLRLFIYM